MRSKLFYALLGTLVCTGTALAVSGGVLLATKHNKDLRRLSERYGLALGRAAAEAVQGSKVRAAAEQGLEKLADTKAAADLRDSRAADRLGELAHYYNVGVWTLLGFVLCFVMAAILGVESMMAAFALGFKVMLALFFAQAALLVYCVTQGCKLI